MSLVSERVARKKRLEEIGYETNLINEPKTAHRDMWWHRDQLNVAGLVVHKAGKAAPHQPSNADTQDRLNVRGLTRSQVDQGYLSLLPWEPGPGCTCRTCKDRFSQPVKAEAVGSAEFFDKVVEQSDALKCDFSGCDYVSSGSGKQQQTRLKLHSRKHAKSAVTV
jgi:hypothetical protein